MENESIVRVESSSIPVVPEWFLWIAATSHSQFQSFRPYSFQLKYVRAKKLLDYNTSIR